jgi:hypothetical protein
MLMMIPESVLRILCFSGGAAMVLLTVFSAVRTFVLPRSSADPLVRGVFHGMRFLFNLGSKLTPTYVLRDQLMAFYAPFSLMALLPSWYFLVSVGYGLIFYALGDMSWVEAFQASMSSVTTLGSTAPQGLLLSFVAFSEAILGLILVALLISYLPTMYAAFSRREAMVAQLEVRAGDPPSAVEMLKRYYRIHGLDRLGVAWTQWEQWFTDVEESHTSLSPLSFFRSPQANHSWVTAAGTVLDAASLTLSAVDVRYDPQAALTIRAGYIALRRIAEFFRVQYNSAPKPSDPISIRREEFNLALDDLAKTGVPLKADRDQAWRDFTGWRVNYDRVLVELARLMDAPPAPWSSDR